jgi:Fe(3+) dicitrate transport protein
MRCIRLFSLLALGLLSITTGRAEEATDPPLSDDGRAVLRVTVLDPQGFPLPNATVRVQGRASEATTDASGLAVVDGLDAGTYTLLVDAPHLTQVRQSHVRVLDGRVASVAVAFETLRSRDTQVDVVGEEDAMLRTIPGAVEAISREELRAAHAIDANQVLRRVAGVTVREDSGPAGMRLNIGIRGLNPDRSRQVLVLEDGVPLALAPYGEPEMYYSPPIERMDRVEVVKGSGSILFGPQTIGGVVNFVTPDPPSTPRGSLDLIGGQYGVFNAQGSFGTTIGATGLFVSAMRKQGDGMRDFEYGINDVTAKVTQQLGANQSLGLKFNAYDEASNSTYLGLTQPQFDVDPRQNAVPDDHLDVRRIFGSAHHRAVLSSRTLLTTTAYAYDTSRNWRRQDFDRLPAAGRTYAGVSGDPSVPSGAIYLRTTSGSRDRQFLVSGVETRLMTDRTAFGRSHAIEAGARYLYERALDQHVNWSSVTGGTSLVRDSERRPAQAIAGFVQDRIALGSRVSLTPGLRFERYAFTRDITRTRVNNVPTDVSIRAGDTVTEWVPGLGLTGQLSPTTTAFAGAHRGFAPPRVKDAITSAGESLLLDAERSWNYEAGLRWQPALGLSGSVTAFRLDFGNQIIPAAQSGGATTTLINGGETLHQGAEATASVDWGALGVAPVRGLVTDLRYTWLPAARFESGIFAGNRLPYAPRHTVTAILGLRDLRGVNAQLDWTLVGSQFGDNHETIAGSIDGTIGRLPHYGLVNVSVDYQARVGRHRFVPFVSVKNATDVLYIASRAPEGIQPGPFRQAIFGIRTMF